MKQYTKDPEATRYYSIDWSADLAELGEDVTIASSEWTVPEGLVVEAEDNTTTIATVKVSGGTVNHDYTLYNKITTSGEDVDRRAIQVRIRDAATFDEPGESEEALKAVRAVMTGSATKNQKEYSIAGRQLVRYDMQELIALETRLVQIVNQERMTAALRSGSPFLKNVNTRFR